ncbi:hypothetical protein OAA21_00280 [bacterium]|nr:hypothetical protein [bacterium]
MSDAIREVQEATIKPYVSISSGGQYNVLDKDGKVAFSTRDGRVANDYLKKNYDKLKEEVELAEGKFEVSSTVTYQGISGEDEVTVVVDAIDKDDAEDVADDMIDDLRRKRKIGPKRGGQVKDVYPFDTERTTKKVGLVDSMMEEIQEASAEQIAKKAHELGVSATVTSKGISVSGFKTQAGMEKFMKYIASQGKNMLTKEEVQEEVSLQEISDKLKLAVLKKKIKQYKDKVFKKTMSTVKSPLFADYEDVEEGRMKDIFTADQEGKSAEEIAKIMKLPLKTVKGILGEEVFEEQILEFTSDMIKRLQKSYSTMPKKISPEQAKALSKHLDRLDLASLKQLTKANIPFVTGLARNKVYKKTGKFEEIQEADKNVDNVKKDDSSKEKELKIKLDKEKDTDALEKQNITLQGQINILKQKLENEKNKAVKPEPNPKTGEVPLTVGVAYKHFKNEKDKEKKQEVSETMSDRDKRIQRAKDMIKYYDAQKKAALKGKNKDLAKKMLKNDIEETVSIKAYKNAVDPSKKGLMISKSGGMSGTIMIKDKKELKDLETKIAQAKRLYNIKEMKKDDAYAIGMAQAKKSMNDEPPLDKKTITKGHEIAKKILNKEEKRVYVESMAGLRKKADKSGMSYSILKKVFDRGMAAWKTGHRPGTSQQQWAYARVNSFITKSSGTWGGADKDLAKQVKG